MTDKTIAGKLGGIFSELISAVKPNETQKTVPQKEKKTDITNKTLNDLQEPIPSMPKNPQPEISCDTGELNFLGSKRNPEEITPLQHPEDQKDNKVHQNLDFSFGHGSPVEPWVDCQNVQAKEFQKTSLLNQSPDDGHFDEADQLPPNEIRIYAEPSPIVQILSYASCYNVQTPFVAYIEQKKQDDTYMIESLQESPRFHTNDELHPEKTSEKIPFCEEENSIWASEVNPLAHIEEQLSRESFLKTQKNRVLQKREIPSINLKIRVRYKEISGVGICSSEQVLASVIRRILPSIDFSAQTTQFLTVDLIGIVENAPFAARLSDLIPSTCRYVDVLVQDQSELDNKVPNKTRNSEDYRIIQRFLSTAGDKRVRPGIDRLLKMFERKGRISNFTLSNSHASVTVFSSIDPAQVNLSKDIRLERLDIQVPPGWRCLVKLFGLNSKTQAKIFDRLLKRRDVVSVTTAGNCVLFITDN